MMEENNTLTENIGMKREFHRFINRVFYNKERKPRELAYLYYLIDDVISFMEKEQEKIGNELLDTDFEVEYYEDKNIKIFNDSQCGILIDTITDKEKSDLLTERNRLYVERDMLGQTKSN